MREQCTGGRGGIRTHGTLAGTPVFKNARTRFARSARVTIRLFYQDNLPISRPMPSAPIWLRLGWFGKLWDKCWDKIERAGQGTMTDEHSRETWARASAHHIVDGALCASERSGGLLPSPDQVALLREIARRALWHMPNSADEARSLVRYVTIENLRQPNPLDDDEPGG
jgi:hypothetical protein